MNDRIDAADIEAGLRVDTVLERFGVDYRDRPEIRLDTCPKCGRTPKRRGKSSPVVVDRETGEWIHHRGASAEHSSCRGGILDLVAALAGLDRRSQFRELLELAAPIAGVTPDTDSAELARRREERRRALAATRAREEAARAVARAAAPAAWGALARRSQRGEAYLRLRGVNPDLLIERDYVRFGVDGWIADGPTVALRDFTTGAIVGLQSRRIHGDEPKIHTSKGCGVIGAALHGRAADVDPEGVDVAVLVEGLMDTLAALLAWPGCAVLGAPGAGHLESVAAAIAPRLAAVRGRLLVVPDVDDDGVTGCIAAVRAAQHAGLVLDRSIILVDVRPAHDLADAWRDGWSPS